MEMFQVLSMFCYVQSSFEVHCEEPIWSATCLPFDRDSCEYSEKVHDYCHIFYDCDEDMIRNEIERMNGDGPTSDTQVNLDIPTSLVQPSPSNSGTSTLSSVLVNKMLSDTSMPNPNNKQDSVRIVENVHIPTTEKPIPERTTAIIPTSADEEKNQGILLPFLKVARKNSQREVFYRQCACPHIDCPRMDCPSCPTSAPFSCPDCPDCPDLTVACDRQINSAPPPRINCPSCPSFKPVFPTCPKCAKCSEQSMLSRENLCPPPIDCPRMDCPSCPTLAPFSCPDCPDLTVACDRQASSTPQPRINCPSCPSFKPVFPTCPKCAKCPEQSMISRENLCPPAQEVICADHPTSGDGCPSPTLEDCFLIFDEMPKNPDLIMPNPVFEYLKSNKKCDCELSWELIFKFLQESAKVGLNETQAWGNKVVSYMGNEVFCNLTTSCSIDLILNPNCPIPINVNATPNCVPPCKTSGCQFIYRYENECPQLSCITLQYTDFGLIFGMLFVVFLIAFVSSVLFCYYRLPNTYRRIIDAMRCSFTIAYNRARNLDIAEGADESLISDAPSTSQSTASLPATTPATPPAREMLRRTRSANVLSPIPETQGTQYFDPNDENSVANDAINWKNVRI